MNARRRAWPFGLLLALASNAWAQGPAKPAVAAPAQTYSQRELGHILQPKMLTSQQSIQSAWRQITSFSEGISSRQKALDEAILDIRRNAIEQSKSAEVLTRALDALDAKTREQRVLFAALHDVQGDILRLTGETYDQLVKTGKLQNKSGVEPAFDAATAKRVAEKKVLIDALIARERAAEQALRRAALLPYD
ncbi:MAG: hypothetical protein JNJ55_07385 [Betaproteobacteria bacterium]|nr:hypothetical protein [Betaproteobacteria bacterium]